MLKERTYQVAWHLAWHRIRDQWRVRFSRLAYLCSILGISLAICGFILLDAFLKFRENSLLQNSLSYFPHAVVTFKKGTDEPIQLRELQDAFARVGLKVSETVPFLFEEALLQGPHGLMPIQIMGVEQWSSEPIVAHQVGHRLPPKPNAWQMWMGVSLARKLGVFPSDRVRLVVPSSQRMTPIGSGMTDRVVQVAALFQTYSEADANQVLLPIEAAKRLLRTTASSGGSYRLTFEDPLLFMTVKRLPHATWKSIEQWQDWRARKGFLARAMQLERSALMLLVWLVTLVASGHLGISLGLRILESATEIAILQTQGFCKWGILLSFWIESLLVIVSGIVLGTVLGFLGRSYFSELAQLCSMGSVAPLDPVSRVELISLGKRFAQMLSLGALTTFVISSYAGTTPPAQVLYREQ